MGANPNHLCRNIREGPGGWISNRRDPLPIFDGVAYLFGPWYLDSHHAPPGAGYLNMLMYLYTKSANHNEKLEAPTVLRLATIPLLLPMPRSRSGFAVTWICKARRWWF